MDHFQATPSEKVISAIECCKSLIRNRAQAAGLRFQDDDIFAIQDQAMFVVWLHRFDPVPVTDDDGIETGAYKYTYPVYAEISQDGPIVEVGEHSFEFSFPLPVFRFPFPWLVFLVNDDGEIKGQFKHFLSRSLE